MRLGRALEVHRLSDPEIGVSGRTSPEGLAVSKESLYLKATENDHERSMVAWSVKCFLPFFAGN